MPEPIVRSATELVPASGIATVLLEAWPASAEIVWQNIQARDLDNTCTRIVLFAKVGAHEYTLFSGVPAAAALSVALPSPVMLPGDIRLGATITGATSGDTLELSVFGYRLDDPGILVVY